MSELLEVPSGLNAYHLLGRLQGVLERDGQISVAEWNNAIEKTPTK